MHVAHIHINEAACDRSPGCPARQVCPRNAIKPIPGGHYPGANGYMVDESLCTGCAVCARFCPTGAVSMG